MSTVYYLGDQLLKGDSLNQQGLRVSGPVYTQNLFTASTTSNVGPITIYSQEANVLTANTTSIYFSTDVVFQALFSNNNFNDVSGQNLIQVAPRTVPAGFIPNPTGGPFYTPSIIQPAYVNTCSEWYGFVNVSRGLSFSFWVKFDDIINVGPAPLFFYQGNLTWGGAPTMSIYVGGLGPTFVVKTSFRDPFGPIIVPGEWYNIILSNALDNGFKCYVNGVMCYSGEGGAGGASCYVDFFIGYDGGNPYYAILESVANSTILEFADMRVYSRALNETDATNIYNGGGAFITSGNIYSSNSFTTPSIFTDTAEISEITAGFVQTQNVYISGNQTVSGTLSGPSASARFLYYGADLQKNAPYLTPNQENGPIIQNWIKNTCNISSNSWWSSQSPSFSNVSTPSNGYTGGVLLPDGRVLFVPGTTSKVGFYNPKTQAFTSVSISAPPNSFSGGFLLPTGNVVFCPYTSNIGIFNPLNNSFSNGASLGGAYSGTLTANNTIFASRGPYSQVLNWNYTTGTATALPSPSYPPIYISTMAVSGSLANFSSNGIVWSTTLGIFVACSSASPYFAVSPDAVTWSASTGAVAGSWTSISENSGNLISCSTGSPYFAYSTDGQNWTSSMPPASNWNAVAVNSSGLFVACSSSSPYFAYDLSASGSWISATTTVSGYWNSVTVSSSGTFVACSQVSPYFAYSTDGQNWLQAPTTHSGLWKSVAVSSSGTFVACSQVSPYFAYSTDGQNWVVAPTPVTNQWTSVTAYSSGMFAALGAYTGVAYSLDGKVWSTSQLPVTSAWNSVTTSFGKAFACTSASPYFAYSINRGETWWAATTTVAGSWKSIALSSSGTFVACSTASPYFARSVDGQNWTTVTTTHVGYWNSVTVSSSGTFVACSSSLPYFALSTDGGQTWLAAPSAVAGSWTSVTVSSSGTFVACSSASPYFAYSTDDGQSWTEVADLSFTGSWTSVTVSSSGTFIACSSASPYFASSTDGGQSWTEPGSLPSELEISWTSVTASSSGTFVACSSASPYFAFSMDEGASWTPATNTVSGQWKSVSASSSGYFMACSSASRYVAYSINGDTWSTTAPPGKGFSIWSAISASPVTGTLTAVSQSSPFVVYKTALSPSWTVATAPSDTFTTVTAAPSGTFVAGTLSQNLFVFSTDDGVTWTEGSGLGYLFPVSGAAAYSSGTLVACSLASPYFIYSIDGGASWQIPLLASLWNSVTATYSGTFSACSSASPYFGYSTNQGISWTSTTTPIAGSWTSLTASSSGTFVACSNTSPYFAYGSGASWTSATTPVASLWTSVAASSSGTFVACSPSSPYFAQSTDGGQTWAAAASPVAGSWTAVTPSSYGIFVASATSSPYFAWSPDGNTWTGALFAAPGTWTGITWSSTFYQFASCDATGLFSLNTLPSRGMCLLPNGNCVFPASWSGDLVEFDPVGLGYSSITLDLNGVNDLILTPDGNITAVTQLSNVFVINPKTYAATTLPIPDSDFTSGCLLPSGNVLFVPSLTSQNVGLFNPGTFEYSNLTETGNSFSSATLIPNGQVVLGPGQGQLGIYDTTSPVPIEFCLSPYFNKF